MAGDIQLAEILNGIRLPFGIIFLVEIDNNLATDGIVYPLHHAVSEPRLYTQKHVARQPLTVCY